MQFSQSLPVLLGGTPRPMWISEAPEDPRSFQRGQKLLPETQQRSLIRNTSGTALSRGAAERPDQLATSWLDSWLEAARTFEMNTDFDVAAELGEEHLDLTDLMGIMKEQSRGKRTIQALGDKILLHKLLSNLGVPQMPMLLSTHGSADSTEVDRLVEKLEESEQDEAFDVVAKPTHLSNSSGTLMLSKQIWESQSYNAEKLSEHMETYLEQKADESESSALQSLVPGFVVQPRYRSCIDFGSPVEIRVVTLWGVTRLAIWWWGPKGHETAQWQRNAWIVHEASSEERRDVERGWQVFHENPQADAKYNAMLQIILQAMPTMALTAEKIARATGAPFLRSDFFVGSPQWGVRLNEVAYGSNIIMRRAARGSQTQHPDDSQRIADILQEGLKVCPRQPPAHFLERLGCRGTSYEPAWWQFWARDQPGMQVTELPAAAGAALPAQPLAGLPMQSPMPATARQPRAGPASSPRPPAAAPGLPRAVSLSGLAQAPSTGRTVLPRSQLFDYRAPQPIVRL